MSLHGTFFAQAPIYANEILMSISSQKRINLAVNIIDGTTKYFRTAFRAKKAPSRIGIRPRALRRQLQTNQGWRIKYSSVNNDQVKRLILEE